jgi:hypothetical protein
MIVPFLMSSLSMLSCSKSSGVDEDDGNSPYAVPDFHVTSTTDRSVTLHWTATGDDADAGTASRYDVRYYSSWINWANWDSASQVSGEPSPSPAGHQDSMTVYGLHEDSTYYFGIRVCDEASNCSQLATCSGTCVRDFEVAFPDSNLEAVIREIISKPSGAILRSDLVHLGNLDANAHEIEDLSGLEYCEDLTNCFMSENKISDLGPIAPLTKIINLQLFHNQLTDLSPLSNKLNIRVLILNSNSINDISALSGMFSLTMINLADNNITDLASLADNASLGPGDTVIVSGNPLSATAIYTEIPVMESRGATVIY